MSNSFLDETTTKSLIAAGVAASIDFIFIKTLITKRQHYYQGV